MPVLKRIAFLSLLLVYLSGCSMQPLEVANPTLARTLVYICEDYLKSIVSEDRGKIQNAMLWSYYLGKKELTEEEYFAQVEMLNKRFPPEAHPLLELTVLDVTADDNNAHITLRRKDWPVDDTFSIDLEWTGTGWVIVNDTLFGKDQLIEFLLKQ